MRKFVKWFLITVLSLFLLLVILIIIAINLRYTYEVDLYTTDTAQRPFVIPVEIDGKSYPFLWDTGAGNSFIDYDFIKKLGYTGDSIIFCNLSTTRSIVSDSIALQKIKIRIGDKPINTEFLMDGYKRYLTPFRSQDAYTSPYTDTTYIGIIGQNVISNFYWLFDFKQKNVTFSQNPIDEIPANTNDRIFKINFDISETGIPVCKLQINQLDSFPFFFDTGNYATMPYFKSGGPTTNINILFIIPDSISRIIQRNSTNMGIELGAVNIISKLMINHDTIPFASWIYADDYKDKDIGYITGSFPYRYSMMYYDPKNKEISFYIPPQDSNYIYKGDNEKIIIDDLVNLRLTDASN